MTIVVTGAAGFIGANLVQYLRVTAGRDVVAIDRREPMSLNGVKYLRADLSMPSDGVEKALGEAEAILHLAGFPGVREQGPDVAGRRHRDNVIATRRVLESTPPDTPIVVTSSSSVYGGSDGTPCSEDQPPRPRGGYAESKVLAERLCAARAAAGGAVVAARLFTVAGEGQRPDMALSRWIKAVAAEQPVHVYGSLERTRDITDVRDVCTSLLALADSRVQGVVNVGTGTPHTLRDMLAAVETALGRAAQVEIRPAHHDDPTATLADPTRLTQTTGIRPYTDLPQLVRRQAVAALGPLAGDDSDQRPNVGSSPELSATGASHDL